MHAHVLEFRFRLIQAVLAIAILLQLAPALASGNDTSKREAVARVAWIYGNSDAAVNAAFAQAKSLGKPVLLYWGATWCPPCNQLKATVFNRSDFIALTRAVIPVYLDGDLPGAQKAGSRFRVVGYPTLILFSADGAEITRLPGEADAAIVIAALKARLVGARPVSAVLAGAQAGTALSASEWLALAFYSWETDEAKLVSPERRATVLAELAARSRAVSPEASSRLWLKSLVAQDKAVAPPMSSPEVLTEQRERLLRMLQSPDTMRQNADVIIEGAAPIVRALTAGANGEREGLLAEYDAALVRLQNDSQLSRADRTGALIARVDLARIDVADESAGVSLPPPLLTEIRTLARRMDAEISNGFERQAVITSVAHLLGLAGLWSESDALLKTNLKRSHAPYYLMSQLGGNARKQGHQVEALEWYQRAYQTSTGPATRLQWGASYVAALIELAPQGSTRIEQAVTSVFADAAKDKAAFYERSARSLKRVIGKLVAWNSAGEHALEVERLRASHRALCEGKADADPQRSLCQALWSDS